MLEIMRAESCNWTCGQPWSVSLFTYDPLAMWLNIYELGHPCPQTPWQWLVMWSWSSHVQFILMLRWLNCLINSFNCCSSLWTHNFLGKCLRCLWSQVVPSIGRVINSCAIIERKFLDLELEQENLLSKGWDISRSSLLLCPKAIPDGGLKQLSPLTTCHHQQGPNVVPNL